MFFIFHCVLDDQVTKVIAAQGGGGGGSESRKDATTILGVFVPKSPSPTRNVERLSRYTAANENRD